VPSAGVFVRVEESCSLTLGQGSLTPPRGYPFPVVQRDAAADHQTATRVGSRRALRSGSGRAQALDAPDRGQTIHGRHQPHHFHGT
jgi:hypothetical protein